MFIDRTSFGSVKCTSMSLFFVVMQDLTIDASTGVSVMTGDMCVCMCACVCVCVYVRNSKSMVCARV